LRLASFIALLQFEVQKAYDHAYELSKEGVNESDSVLHIALESVELDIPLTYKQARVAQDRRETEKEESPQYRLDRPFVEGTGESKAKGEGLSIEVSLAPPAKRAGKEGGKLKITLKPFLR